MKSKILKGIIVASAIAFVNCSDDATAPDFNNQQSTYSSSVELLALSSSSVETPASSAADLNLSSAEVQVSSSSDAATSSVTEISS